MKNVLAVNWLKYFSFILYRKTLYFSGKPNLVTKNLLTRSLLTVQYSNKEFSYSVIYSQKNEKY